MHTKREQTIKACKLFKIILILRQSFRGVARLQRAKWGGGNGAKQNMHNLFSIL